MDSTFITADNQTLMRPAPATVQFYVRHAIELIDTEARGMRSMRRDPELVGALLKRAVDGKGLKAMSCRYGRAHTQRSRNASRNPVPPEAVSLTCRR